MYDPKIDQLKTHLNTLKEKKVLKDWDLPSKQTTEQNRTVTFFVTPFNEQNLSDLINEFGKYENLKCIVNINKKSSKLDYTISFSRRIFI